MDRLLVLVNGLPGSGKTTLGSAVARTMDAWFLSKDTVREALVGCLENAVGVPELGGSRSTQRGRWLRGHRSMWS
ncbi:AAA family ATPase [Nocardia sp.]|uniref:AAA family ATPase n=1 Tax=Nocardia sp. TaxID=1821 RepID=UPI003452A37C